MPQPNPKYDGLMIFQPIVSRLKSGDILLTKNAESDKRKDLKQSDIIARATGGRFSHALICSVPPTFVEAIGLGVSTLSFARCFAHSLENVRILRHPNPAIAEKAGSLAQLEIGRDYSAVKAIASIFPQQLIAKIKGTGIFCSALVAQAFISAGDSSFAGTPVENTTPATIEKMTGLVDVTDKVFQRILSPMNIEAFSALDGDRVISPSALQTEIYNRYAKEVVPDATRIASTYPGAGLGAANTVFDTLLLIMKAIDAIQTIPSEERSNFESEVMALDNKLANLFDRGELLAVSKEMEKLDGAELQRSLKESFEQSPDIDMQAMLSMLEASKEQLEKRQESLASFRSWGSNRSRSLTHYVELHAAVVSFLDLRVATFTEIIGRIG